MQIIHVNLASSLSGGEYQTLALMSGLRDMGTEQWLVHRQGSRVGALAKEQNLRTLTAGQAFFSLRAGCWRKPVILHAHDGRAVHWARISAGLHHLPYLVTRRTHTIPKDNRWTHGTYANACRVACVSGFVEEGMQDYDATLNSCVVHDGVVGFSSDAECSKKLREAHSSRVIVAQVGRLAIEKEVGVTLEVARQLAAKNLPLQFWILGDGPMRTELQAAAADLDNVEFFGHRDDIGDFLAAADVLVHPARHEAFGSVIVEAMQQGVAVIASRVGGIPEVVLDNQTGLLIECGDVAGFCAAIEKMCNEPELMARMANAGRERAELFSLEVMTERYLQLYRQCLEDFSRS
ncbi:MAG: glycosyltransferase family 4 protein [Proteobacteria bacterium]|nr:glycosyltransferase family 4 protein [Pseudomonadota bacterium]